MKSFKEITQINLSKYIEEKQGINYLNWAKAWEILKNLDEKAEYTIHENSEGNAFFVSQFGIDVKVSVKFNGTTHTMRLPVLDGANNAMKTEKYTYTVKKYKWDNALKKKVEDGTEEKTVEAADSFDINKTIMRCLVKAIAMHGVGLYLYTGEEAPVETSVAVFVKEYTDAQKITLEKRGYKANKSNFLAKKVLGSEVEKELKQLEDWEIKAETKIISEAAPAV